ncbi:MAG: hypothetical protein KY429_01365 [Actinobacteria bacterium]|nr:hypothetical protein [Actinomycetota bacterium]
MDKSNRKREIAASEAGIVVDWLLKVVIILVVVGVALFELGAIVLVRATAADTAAKAGQEAGFTFRATGNVERAKEAAQEIAEKEGAVLVSFSVDTERKVTRTTVSKKSKSIFIHRIGALEKYTVATSTQEVPIPS